MRSRSPLIAKPVRLCLARTPFKTYQAALNGDGRSFGSISHTKLIQTTYNMISYGPMAQVHQVGYLAICKSMHDKFEYLLLSWA